MKVLELPLKEVLFYSDSMDVLWWIRGKERDFRSFVANRIAELQMHTDPSHWQHVSIESANKDVNNATKETWNHTQQENSNARIFQIFVFVMRSN